ncbi:MAG: iron-sulfur cluster assembly accessory protein [Chloroflexi bacterium]|nr:iron-sulfur cluster assembly accessory protein [Chloroflexota bacterium]
MFSITLTAQEKLKEVLDSRGSPDAPVRVVAVHGPHGCIHGWKLAIEEAGEPQDTVVCAGDVCILVEPELVDILDGASIDYREDSLGIGFVIEVPNAPPPMHQHGGGCHH